VAKTKKKLDISPSNASAGLPESRGSSSHEPTSMEELLRTTGYTIHGFKRGDEVKGKIMAISPKQMTIEIGGKSFGVVPPREMAAIADLLSQLSVGEEVTAMVVVPEDEYGQVLLSLRKSSVEKRWQVLKDAHDQGKEISVTGIDSVKGGLLVDYAGVRGFIPASQLDAASIDNPGLLRGRKIAVKILELEKEGNRLVLSQKAVTQKDLIVSQQAALAKIKDGDVLEATIMGVVPFGAFAQVTLPQEKEGETVTIEGLIHISEIAWERVESPGDHLKTGEKVKVKVIGKDEASGRLNLSLKQLSKDPWGEASKKYVEDQVVEGRVTRTSHFGVFVQLEPGVEGLIHISKMPTDFAPKVGDTIKAMIESIDLEKRKLSLSVVATEKPIGYR